MPDAVETPGQNVEQKAADELGRLECHDLVEVQAAATIVLVSEGHTCLVEREQPPVRDGDTVRVAREIRQHRFRPGEGRLGVDHPSPLPDWSEITQKGPAIGETGLAAEEDELARAMQLDQSGQEQPAEELAQHPDRQEESRTRGNPARTIVRDAAAGYDHVNMGMMRHGRTPGVEHGGDADAGAEVLGIGSDRHHRLRGRPEQQIVDQGFVLPSDAGDLGRQREDDMEIADRQKVGFPRRQPRARRGGLTLGAMPVAAANGERPLAALD